jgi:hypothetical protein
MMLVLTLMLFLPLPLTLMLFLPLTLTLILPLPLTLMLPLIPYFLLLFSRAFESRNTTARLTKE